MAAGVPVVATTVGAFPELVVPGETGALVPPGDVGAMEVEVARLLDDGSLRARMGTNARRHVARHFTLESEASAINEVYLGLLG
jgi:mannosyltransferase